MIQSRSSRYSKGLGVLLAVCWWALPASAQALGQGVQAHGFISQSLVYTSDNNVGGDSDDSVATNLRELGANVSWRANPDWLLSGQLLARWAGEADKGELRLDYGFADRSLFSDGENQVGVRFGKIKNPYGFYNTTRDVAHTRPGIIMPQSIYLDRIRNFLLSAPGAAAYGNHGAQNMEISWSLGAVRFDADNVDLEQLFLLSDRPGRYQGDTSWVGQVMADVDGGRWRLGLTLADVNMHYQPGTDLAMNARNRLLPIVLSVERNMEKFSLTGEYSQVKHDSQMSGSHPLVPLLERPNTLETWYLQATYRPSPDWRVYLRRDEIYLDKDDKKGLRDGHGFLTFAKDWTLGTRYDFDAWSLSAEFHKVQGTLWLSPQDTPITSQKENWNMLLLQAAWRF